MAGKCSQCSKTAGLFKGIRIRKILDLELCGSCAPGYVKQVTSSVIISTTPSLDGYNILTYIDIESVEIVLGTGIFSEFDGALADFFGARSQPFEEKLQRAKGLAFDKLRLTALEKGGNAVIGVDLDYTQFSRNLIGLIANGTIVKAEPSYPIESAASVEVRNSKYLE